MNKTICLNMIVKDESHIIEKTLNNIISQIPITYWVISDTGSSDNTKEIITNFFKEKNIPGELIENEWKDFSYNRTLAINHAFDKTDYLFFFDADDYIHGNLQLPLELNNDNYLLKFGCGIEYTRPLLVSNRIRWKYNGVLHEYLVNIGDIKGTAVVDGDYWIESGRTGARNLNPNKYRDDGLVLEKGFEEEKEDESLKNRYAYYAGQSFEDAGMFQKAVEWYEKLLPLNFSPQYKYVACVRAGNCYSKLKNIERSMFFWMKSYEFDNERLDGIVRLMEFYYNNGLHFMVVSLYEKFKNVNVGNFVSKIFYDDSVYSKFNYYNQISGCYADGKKSAYDSCKYLCLNNAPDWMKFNAMNNMVFYKDHFESDENNKDFIKYLINFLQTSFDEEKNKIIWSYSGELIKKHFPETHDWLHLWNNCIECDFKIVNIKKDDSYKKSKKILIYTGPMYHDWNYNDFLYKSLGGSEKAVVYLSNNLPKEYEIYISGMVKEESFGNISYVNERNLQKLIDENNFHTIIVSRYACFINRFQNIKCFQLFLSLHDTYILSVNGIDIKKCIYNNIDQIDGVVVLTKTHKKMIQKLFSRLKDKMHIINNGIELDAFKDNKIGFKVKNSFIWSSCSERGLDILLGLWEEILIKMPDATLEICSYDTFPKTEDDTKMLEIITKHSSINHRGKLNKNDLYALMEQTEYWLYTCTFAETSCITALEMLASNIVCIYYPVAALVDTLGDYGIPVNRGEEIVTLMELTEEKKRDIRIRGKEYAKLCSWKHRYKKWEKMLGIKKRKCKIGIFNSFPFHYEMFGFILNYANAHNHKVDIFTNQSNDLGWLDFYREKFNNFKVIDYQKFDGTMDKYDKFFLTTDDDPCFKPEWISDNVICINHYYKIRTPNCKFYLNCANFKDSNLEYTYPCYPLINNFDKKQCSIVNIIGGKEHNIHIINRLQSKNKIKLNIFARYPPNISELNKEMFEINMIENGNTCEMIEELKQGSYIFINNTPNNDHNTGISCSGSLQLALSTLCKPIMMNTSNKYLQIENALEFDAESSEPINIDGEIDFKALEDERTKYVDKFSNYLTTIFKKGIALIVEPRKLEKLDKIITHVYNKLNNNSKYNWEILFYCGKGLKTYYLSLFHNIKINIIELDTNNFEDIEYNDFLKSLSLWNNINSEYTLVFQADCYIFNNPPYTVDYFMDKNYSYIGGNMSYTWRELEHHNFNSEFRNFNGGLSLRKTKDMINIIQTFQPQPSIKEIDKLESYGEDVYFTIGAYKLNLKIGNTEDDQYFACHSIITDKCFGIHNSDMFLDKKRLLEIYPEVYNQSYIVSDMHKE